MQHARLSYLSEAEYLQGEEGTDVRHEYVAGQTFAMAGASKAHNAISLNLVGQIRSHLRGSPCRTYMADMKVRVEHADGVSHYYPDVVVTCSPQDTRPDAPTHYLLDPILVVEVLSAATESTDRREKMLAYGRLRGLKEYLLVDSQRQCVEIYRKNESGGWDVDIPAADETVNLSSINLELGFADIYEDSGVSTC
jgi:Uma2 family endonuclease